MGASSGLGDLPVRFTTVPATQRRQSPEAYAFLPSSCNPFSNTLQATKQPRETRQRPVSPMDETAPQRQRNPNINGLHEDLSMLRSSTTQIKIPEQMTDGALQPSPSPIFVMLPLDTVNADGKFKYRSSQWFLEAISMIAKSGVTGVAVDIWWGVVEKHPRAYDWRGYRDLVKVIKQKGLLLQVVLSFHACGGNVGDIVQIPLPQWVLKCGECDPDIFLSDRPRQYTAGHRNRECLSLFADEMPDILCGRSPMECYTEFMSAFREEFEPELGTLILDVVIGAGPCGELRYPSYSEASGWQFPGVGEFQCYDRFALSSLAKAAADAGHPEWGHGGPRNAGEYNYRPWDVAFFCPRSGSWKTSYGRFFLTWYSNALIQHGRRLLTAANAVFRTKSNHPRRSPGKETPTPMHGIGAWVAKTSCRWCGSPSTVCATEGRLSESSVDLSARTNSMTSIRRDASIDSITREFAAGDSNPTFWPDLGVSSVFDVETGTMASIHIFPPLKPVSLTNVTAPGSASTDINNDEPFVSKRWDSGEPARRTESGIGESRAVGLSLKIAGVHWWYKTESHAAELTAGYYNTRDRCGYEAIIRMCREFDVGLTLTCVEMSDDQHSDDKCCSPQGLLEQVRRGASAAGVRFSGENALPIFHPGHSGADVRGLDRIVAICQGPATTAGNGAGGGRLTACNNNTRATNQARLHSFTFLRLGPEIMQPMQRRVWDGFMRRVRQPQQLDFFASSS